MKDVFITVIAVFAFAAWVGFALYFYNATQPHAGGWQFMVGSGLIAVAAFGLAAPLKNGE